MIKKLHWYLNRLSLMSFSEICFRFINEVKKKIVTYRINDPIVQLSVITRNINWYCDLSKKNEICDVYNQHKYFDEVALESLLNHSFSFFALDKTDFGKHIDWHKDYKNNKTAPLKPVVDINYRDYKQVGDIKYIWEHNRHLHLVSLAKGYYLTQKHIYKDEVTAQISSWIERNPFMKGVNWESSLELGIRLISWSWVWNFIGDFDDDFKKIWLENIYKHCCAISRKFSQFSSANNHLVGEAAGLFIASIVWPFWDESKKWQDKSSSILFEEIKKQNYSDGVNKEQAISYQQFVLDFFILAGLIGEKNGANFPKNYWDRIEHMLDYVASLMDNAGNMPNIGDADDGYAVRLSDDLTFNPFRSLLATGAVIFNRWDFKSKAGCFDEKSFWILGIEGVDKFNALEEKKFETKKRFDEGGYYILSTNEDKDDEIKSVFDCGPLGYLTLAAHGHADALNFTLNVKGKEIIIDPGTYAYHTQKEWREYFKGTAAHNTIRIDRESQSLSGGNFMWLKKAQARLLEYETNSNFDRVKGEHYGYKRLKDPVIHQRKIIFDKSTRSFRIIDNILTKKDHFLEQCFHFSKDCEVTQNDDTEFTIKNANVSIVMILDKQLKSKLFNGSVDPIFGWESKRFDVKHEIITLVNSCEIKGSCELITQIKVN